MRFYFRVAESIEGQEALGVYTRHYDSGREEYDEGKRKEACGVRRSGGWTETEWQRAAAGGGWMIVVDATWPGLGVASPG